MQCLIALLRAVNVGGTGKLPMADLRAMAEGLGFEDVRSYIQTGNLLFSTTHDALDAKSMLEKTLEVYAGKPVGVILRSAEALRVTQAANPFANADPKKVGVLFLDAPPSADSIETAKGRTDEEIALGLQEIFIHYPNGMGQSRLRLHAMNAGTMRNANTVAKLIEMTNKNAA